MKKVRNHHQILLVQKLIPKNSKRLLFFLFTFLIFSFDVSAWIPEPLVAQSINNKVIETDRLLGAIKTEIGSLYANVDLQGFTISQKADSLPKNCQSLSSVSFQLHLIIAKLNNKFEFFNEYIKKCLTAHHNKLAAMMDLATTSVKNLDDLDKRIKQYNLSKSEKQKIEGIYKKKHSKVQLYHQKMLKIFIQQTNTWYDSKSRHQKFIESRNILKELENAPPGVFSDLIRIIVYLKQNNTSFAKRVIKGIVRNHFDKRIFEINRSIFQDVNERSQLQKSFVIFLKIVRNEIKDKMLTKIFMTYWNNSSLISSSEEFVDEFFVDWSVSEINTVMKSYNYGSPLTGFWFLAMAKKDKKQAEDLLASVMTVDYIKKIDDDLMWVFYHYFPKDETRQKVVLDVLKKKAKSNSNHIKYLLIRMVDKYESNHGLKKIAKINNEKFFTGLLREGLAIELSIFRSIKMKKANNDLLWWMVL